MEKRKPERSVWGLIAGTLVIIDILVVYFNIKSSISSDNLADYIAGTAAQNALQIPMILGVLAGAASITAYFAYFRYAHLIGVGLLIIAIIEVPAYMEPEVFYGDAISLFICFLRDCYLEWQEKRQVDDVLNGTRPIYNYQTKSYEYLSPNDGLVDDELKLLDYYRVLDEDEKRRVRRFAKKLGNKEEQH